MCIVKRKSTQNVWFIITGNGFILIFKKLLHIYMGIWTFPKSKPNSKNILHEFLFNISSQNISQYIVFKNSSPPIKSHTVENITLTE